MLARTNSTACDINQSGITMRMANLIYLSKGTPAIAQRTTVIPRQGHPPAFDGGCHHFRLHFGRQALPAVGHDAAGLRLHNTNIFEHVISMLYTTVPLALLSLVLYAVLGMQYGGSAVDTTQIALLIDGLESSFRMGIVPLLPVALVLVLSFKRLPPMAVFGLSIVASMALAVFYQGAGWKEVFSVTVNGFESVTGMESLDNLLSRGGILSMMSITMLSILAGALTGLLDHMSILRIFIGRVSRGVRSPAGMVTLTTGVCTGMSVAACDQYLILTLPGIAFRPSYDEMDIHSSVLSRTMEDTGTVFGSINPWHFTSTFFVGTFGVPVLAYAPFAFFPLLSPLMAILNAWLGIGLFRCSDPIRYRPFWRRPKESKTVHAGSEAMSPEAIAKS